MEKQLCKDLDFLLGELKTKNIKRTDLELVCKGKIEYNCFELIKILKGDKYIIEDTFRDFIIEFKGISFISNGGYASLRKEKIKSNTSFYLIIASVIIALMSLVVSILVILK